MKRRVYFDGSVQERRNSSALEMELRIFGTNPLILGWSPVVWQYQHILDTKKSESIYKDLAKIAECINNFVMEKF